MSETQIFDLAPSDIIVRDDLPRYRKDIPKLEKLIASIKQFGQLQPIVISRNKELIAGGRRLTACIMGEIPTIKVCYVDTLDPVTMREMELEENLQREDLTPAEYNLGIADLLALKQSIHGKPTSGRQGGYTIAQAAELIGKSTAAVQDALNVAKMLHEFPELASAKSTSEIKKAYRGLERIQQSMDALASYEETAKVNDLYNLQCLDAVEWMRTIPDQSIDLLLTDPPYGINIHDVAMTVGGATGGELTTTGIKYDDSEKSAKAILLILAAESYRFTKPNAHAYIFCAPSHFWWLKETMQSAGWLTTDRPMIWIKRTTGQNNWPGMWPSSAYEFILFARKVDSAIIVQGKPDWIQCNPVTESIRTHQAEKPVELIKELISRVCYPGAFICDPFCGSGAIIEAAVSMKMYAQGCDSALECYAGATKRLEEWRKKNG